MVHDRSQGASSNDSAKAQLTARARCILQVDFDLLHCSEMTFWDDGDEVGKGDQAGKDELVGSVDDSSGLFRHGTGYEEEADDGFDGFAMPDVFLRVAKTFATFGCSPALQFSDVSLWMLTDINGNVGE